MNLEFKLQGVDQGSLCSGQVLLLLLCSGEAHGSNFFRFVTCVEFSHRRLRMRLAILVLMLIGMFGSSPLIAQTTSQDVKPRPDVRFTLRTDIAEGQLVYISESGPTKGQVNPDLRVPENAVVQISVINGDGAIHDI